MLGGAEIRRPYGTAAQSNSPTPCPSKDDAWTTLPNIASNRLHQRVLESGPTCTSSFWRVLNYMDSHGYDTVAPQHPGDRWKTSVRDGLHAPDMAARIGTICRRRVQSPVGSSRTICSTLQLIRRGRVMTRRCIRPKSLPRWRVELGSAAATTTIRHRRGRRCRRARIPTPPKPTVTSSSPAPVFPFLSGLVPRRL